MIAFRPMQPDDRKFVISNWSSSFRVSTYAGMISNATWATVMHAEIGALIDRPSTMVIVGWEPDEKDHLGRDFLYGFVAARRGDPYVHYCYVKHDYRKRGFARRLLEAAGVDPDGRFSYSFRTSVLADLAGKMPRAVWEPVSTKEGM